MLDTQTLDSRELTAIPDDLLSREVFDENLAAMRSAPSWLRDLKEKAWAEFSSLPFPGRRDEQWRYGRPGEFSLNGFGVAGNPAPSDSEALITASHCIENFSGKLIFADNHMIWERRLPEQLLESGVKMVPLATAWNQHGDILQKYFFQRTPELGAQKFEKLHAALVSNGTLIYVPRGVEIESPIVIRHWACSDQTALFPHTLVVAEDHARVDVVELFESRQASLNNFVCGMATVFAGAGARVFYKSVQDWNLNTVSLHLNSVHAERDSNVRTIVLNLGSSYCRNEQHTRTTGPGSEVSNLALNTPSGEQEYDMRSLQTHCAPNTRSNLLYKNALMDRSKTTFAGLIKVEKQGQHTDAYQTVRNLLLNGSAQANSLPGLEILANDVKCSHGATTGMLDEDQLFYLRTRGVADGDAQRLLVFGFCEEVLGEIKNAELRDSLRRLLNRKLSGCGSSGPGTDHKK